MRVASGIASGGAMVINLIEFQKDLPRSDFIDRYGRARGSMRRGVHRRAGQVSFGDRVAHCRAQRSFATARSGCSSAQPLRAPDEPDRRHGHGALQTALELAIRGDLLGHTIEIQHRGAGAAPPSECYVASCLAAQAQRSWMSCAGAKRQSPCGATCTSTTPTSAEHETEDGLTVVPRPESRSPPPWN